MPVHFIAHAAPPLACVSASGTARGIARRLAHGYHPPEAALVAAARDNALKAGLPGRVSAVGSFRSSAVSKQLAAALGPVLAPALRDELEWYVCRGALFHNDAHYESVLFGVWCVQGPAADIIFPRAGLRLPAWPGNLAVFDPYEVHGVLATSKASYAAEDYADAEPSVFVGFELSLAPVRDAFDIGAGIDGRPISSKTRIAAATGAFE
jgi:hypothetical protein